MVNKMKIRTKFSIASGIVVFIVISLLSFSSYLLISNTLEEKTQAYVEDNSLLLAQGISHWLSGKTVQIRLLKNNIEENYSVATFQSNLEFSSLKEDFLLMFGTLSNERGLRSNDPNRVNPDNIDFKERPWYKLGKSQLENSSIAEAIESYLKAEDAQDYAEVIQAAEREENFDELVRYLVMARQKVKDQAIDTELVYSYAKTDRLGDMEEFLRCPMDSFLVFFSGYVT